MKRRKLTILACLALLVCLASVAFALVRQSTESQRIAAANRAEYDQIFYRCEYVPELKQFIDLYNPEVALEFFDNTKVVSVTCVVQVDARYSATFNAPVSVNDSGFYELTGELMFSITDNMGEFRTIRQNGFSDSPSIRMNAGEWTHFVTTGANIESLRTTYASGQ